MGPAGQAAEGAYLDGLPIEKLAGGPLPRAEHHPGPPEQVLLYLATDKPNEFWVETLVPAQDEGA